MTRFVPDDLKIAQCLNNSESPVNLTSSEVQNFTSTHIYGAELESQDFVPCFNKSFNMSSGDSVSISVNSTQVELSNRNFTARLTKFDLFYDQGVVHILDNAIASLSPACDAIFQ